MAMNRQTKRMLQRQGQLDRDGEPVVRRRPPPQAQRPRAEEGRTGPRQFIREVRGELRKVAWPTRPEVANYSLIVLVALIIMTAFIAGLDWVFSEAVFRLFER
jgi:preprotein translocase subunit SecE